MKLTRLLCAVLACLLCIPTLAVTADTSAYAQALPISAPKAVYVKDGGTGDGSSAGKPLSSLSNAFKALKSTGGYIVICGPVTVSESNFKTPACDNTVTITSKYAGTDFGASGAKLTLKISSFYFQSNIKMEYLNLEFSKAVNIYMCYNDLHVGDEVNTVRASASGTYRYPILIGGKVFSTTDTPAKASNYRDTVIRIDSGTWDTVFCGNYRSGAEQPIGVNYGRSALIINGGHFTRTSDKSFPVSASGMNYFSGDVYMEINGGIFDNYVFAVARTGTWPDDEENMMAKRTNTGDVLVRITGGEFLNTVGLSCAYDASSGNNAYIKNYVVNGDATFVITGGVFKKEFITYCACGDLLLKYDPNHLQSDFLSLCINFPIKQKISKNDAPDTDSKYVKAQVDQQIDKLAHGADPYVIADPKDDCYYYVYSSGGVKITKSGNIGLFKQGITAENVAGINNFSKIYNGIKIVNASKYPDDGPCTQYWAPEIHYIPREIAGDDYGWYCYVAASDSSGEDAAHRMYVFRSPNPDDPMCENWELMGKITDSSNYWAIDGTVIMWGNEMYFAWSGRESSDLSSKSQNICIAKMKNPWTLSEDRSILSTPSQSWERKNTNPAVNEGPQAFTYNGKLYLTYSANGSWTKNYCVGILTYNGTGSLSDPANWTKNTAAPFFSRNSLNIKSPYGTGHGSVIMDLEGKPWLVFHANPTTETSTEANWWSRRMIYAQPLSFGSNGAIVKNYANNIGTQNTISAHNGECCSEHFYAGFDYPADACLYCREEKNVAVRGDIDLDRYVTNADITALIRILSGYEKPTMYCDLDKNGKVSNRDAIELIKMLV